MDFQEEVGSPSLSDAVSQNRQLLDPDMLFIMDARDISQTRPHSHLALREPATAILKVFGTNHPLHSGQYGNFAPNPVFQTARLLSGLKDENGKTTLEGYYDGVDSSKEEKAQLNNVLENLDPIKTRLGISKIDAIGTIYQEALQYPSINIRGMKAAWASNEMRTTTPSEVIVEINTRLLPESDGERLMKLLKNYIEKQGHHLVDSIPTKD